jgi:hypothetical protein
MTLLRDLGAYGLPEEHGEQVLAQRDEEPQGAQEQPGPGAGQHPGVHFVSISVSAQIITRMMAKNMSQCYR